MTNTLGNQSKRRKTKYDTRPAEDLKKIIMSAKPKKQKTVLNFKDGLPKIKLKQLKNTAVYVEEQKEFDTMMQLYECARWTYYRFPKKPTEVEKPDYGKTYIDAYMTKSESEKGFTTSTGELYSGNSISLETFLKEQKISKEYVKKINGWFSENKPNRNSRHTFDLPF
jgi:hypothetical protein